MKREIYSVKRLSFRLRIAFLSALLSGSALIGFGGFSWWLIRQTHLNRIDNTFKTQLRQESDRPRPTNHWGSYVTVLPQTFGAKNSDHVALLVQDGTHKMIYQSPTWSADLTKVATFIPLPPPPQGIRAPEAMPPNAMPPEGQEPPNAMPPEGQKISQGKAFQGKASQGQTSQGKASQGQTSQEKASQGQDRFPVPPPFPGPPPFAKQEFPQLPQGYPSEFSELLTETTPTGTWRMGTVNTPHVRIAIAVNLKTIDNEMDVIRNTLLATIPGVLAMISIGSWWLSGSALQPIREITATLRRVTAKGLDQRIPIQSRDREFVELLQVFNQMMERLERSFNQASRFSADAAHELKTPLSILQGELERTLQAAEPGSDLQQRLTSLLDEVGRLGTIVRKLLLLSLADAGQMRLHTTEVDLSNLLADLVDDIDMLAPDLQVHMHVEPSLRVQADQSLLMQVLQNLISNATKYNLPQGWVKFHAGRRNQAVFVTISNSSKDIPTSERSRIFDRFHRGDPARTRNVEGFGLGLSLSREIVYAHGGNLTLDATPSGETAFTLTFPT